MAIKKWLKPVSDAFMSAVQVALGSSAIHAPSNWKYERPEALKGQDLDNLYAGHGLARRVVDLKPKMALKGGLGFSDAATLEYQRLGVSKRYPDGVVMRAAILARLHGGSCIVGCHEVGAGDMTQPIEEGASPGALLWLDVFSRSELKIISTSGDENPAAVDYDTPLLFEVTADGHRKGLQFHASRALFFMGDAAPPSDYKVNDNFWGTSIITAGYESLLRLGQRDAAIDRAMLKLSIQALELKGLLESIAKQDEGQLINRLSVLQMGIERSNMILLDEGEKAAQYNGSFSGLEATIDQAQARVAADYSYPVTKLFGISPGGLNATGESDLTNLYDELEEWRNSILPQLTTLASWLTQQDEKVTFKPLRTPTGKEASEQLKAEVETYDTLDEWGVTEAADFVKSLQKRGLFDPEIPVHEAEAEDTQANTPPLPPMDPNAPPQKTQTQGA